MSLALPALAAPDLSPADRTAVFKAAGFKQKGSEWRRCEEDPPTMSSTPGNIEVADLNGDGLPEAWVTESSTFCYGNTAQMVVLLTKEKSGTWRKLIDEVGVSMVEKGVHQGWPDVTVGGPGFGRPPLFRWNGKGYARTK